MRYEKFRPNERLAPYVECYFIWESDGVLEEEMVVESPPNSFSSIVINYGTPYRLQNKKYSRLDVPAQFVAGLSLYSYKLFLRGTIGIAGIVFKPAALSSLFGLPAFELTEERSDLLTLLPLPYVRKAVQEIHGTVDAKQKVMILENMLLQHISLNNPEEDYIDRAANLIVEANGMLHVQDLLKDSCMSRRTFERRFLHKVGISPKYYARIRRISYVCNLIAGKKKVNWPEIFYEADFYDHAHFIRDFEEFLGRTPQQYLRENTELAQYIPKPSTQSITGKSKEAHQSDA